MTLDPYNLTPAASLNRVRLVSGAGLVLPAHIEGFTAYGLLGAVAYTELMREADPDGVETTGGTNLTEIVEAWSRSRSTASREAAAYVTREYASRLAFLMATLKLGSHQAREARPEWDESYWRHWATIERLCLAGGLATRAIASAASEKLSDLGIACAIVVAPHPVIAPLLGAARCLNGVAEGYCFDFGQTAVKRGIARFENGELASCAVLEAAPSPVAVSERRPEAMVRIISEAITTSHRLETEVKIAMCLAAYVYGNHPLDPPHAAYADLTGIENLGAWLSAELGAQLHSSVTVRLLHDATSAALSVSPSPRTAVITLGTALGIGFGREQAGDLLPFSPRFEVTGAI